MYIYIHIYLSIDLYLPPIREPNARAVSPRGSLPKLAGSRPPYKKRLVEVVGLSSAFTRYRFTSKLDCGNLSSLYPPPPSCNAYPIAILLHDFCAIYAPQPTPPPLLYAIHHTRLVMALLCKVQVCSDFPLPPLRAT